MSKGSFTIYFSEADSRSPLQSSSRWVLRPGAKGEEVSHRFLKGGVAIRFIFLRKGKKSRRWPLSWRICVDAGILQAYAQTTTGWLQPLRLPLCMFQMSLHSIQLWSCLFVRLVSAQRGSARHYQVFLRVHKLNHVFFQRAEWSLGTFLFVFFFRRVH